ncbi:MAG: PhoU domain-containing protein [Desulfobacteraceae bacterium]
MHDNLMDNMRFLVDQTLLQLDEVDSLFNDFSEEKVNRITSKEDYIDNLKVLIENECFSIIHHNPLAKRQMDKIRSIHVIAINLERIADYIVNIADQTMYYINLSYLTRFDHRVFVEKIKSGLLTLLTVLREDDLSKALDICKIEYEIDLIYKEYFDSLMELFNTGERHEDLITSIFIHRYFERIGDSILNIGEALIFAIIGDRIKIRHFEALEQNITGTEFGGDIFDITAEPILGSRSGCRISRVRKETGSDTKEQGIFKEGDRKKIHSEYENILKWQRIREDLTPKVYGYLEKEGKASMLVECLAGKTGDRIVLEESGETLETLETLLCDTVVHCWRDTLKREEKNAGFGLQMQERADYVDYTHPDFFRKEMAPGQKQALSTRQLICRLTEIEKDLPAPFSVFIHGDFNLNNIIFNQTEGRIHYIDTYRSCMSDYVQDASVCLVSAFRLPVFKGEGRDRINRFIRDMYRCFEGFAAESGDPTFEARLSLALARSFFTSTRFALNNKFAREMFSRSEYIMDEIASYTGSWENFPFRQSVLYYQASV